MSIGVGVIWGGDQHLLWLITYNWLIFLYERERERVQFRNSRNLSNSLAVFNSLQGASLQGV